MTDVGQSPQLIEQPQEEKVRKRPSVRLYSKTSVAKLKELGFDPIEKLVKLYDQVSAEIEDYENTARGLVKLKGDGTYHRKYNGMAHSNLLALQQKLLNDLMRYGYARVPETVNVNEHKELPGVTINLTPKGGVFQDTSNITIPKDIIDVDEE